MKAKLAARSIVGFALLISIASCVYFLGRGDLTARESALLSIVLTGLSVLASWLVTDVYSASQYELAIQEVQEQHRSNLRTYALKAAEKVNNLSSELHRLSAYLQQELEFTDYRSVDEELQAKEERLESAIHIIITLKSVNDTSLSDWQGVIGDELEEQREEKHEQEEFLRDQIKEMEDQILPQLSLLQASQHNTEELQKQLEFVRRDLRAMVSAAGGVTLPLPRISKTRQNVEAHCPSCGKINKFIARRKVGLLKPLTCADCRARLVAHFDPERGHFLTMRKPTVEHYSCPECHTGNSTEIDIVNGASVFAICNSCRHHLHIVRSKSGLKVRLVTPESAAQVSIGTKIALTEELIARVAAALPPQPWPTGTHRKVADELMLTSSTIARAIDVLIQRGKFMHQENGVLTLGAARSEAQKDRVSAYGE